MEQDDAEIEEEEDGDDQQVKFLSILFMASIDMGRLRQS